METAHQKDSLLFRDSLLSNNNCQQQQHSLLLDHNCDLIQSAIPMERQEVGYQQQQRWNQMGQVATNRQGVTSTTASTTTTNATARKTTTAQTFFKTEPKAAAAVSTTTTSTKATTAAPPKKAFFGAASTTTTKKDKKKEATKKEPEPMETNVGTADDFMGDADEDEEFLEQEELRKDRKAEQEAKEVEREELLRQRDAERKEAQKRVQDDEQEQARQQQPTTGKKRRKKMVEKTTMDEHGYMHTETHVEWEEIDVIDEPVALRKKVATKKNTKNLKQGNLMGFFTKK